MLCAVSIATLRVLDLSFFAISVCSSSAKSMYSSMIVSSVSVVSLSFLFCAGFVDAGVSLLVV